MEHEMPQPWFRAQSTGRRISAGLFDEPIRPPREGERRIAGFILPPFQRPPEWSLEQKVALIESIWDGLPIGAYVVNRIEDPNGETADWLLDGQQRWTAMSEYVAGEFEVMGFRYPDLSPLARLDFRGRPISEIETKLTDPADCERIYRKLAYGGTPHQPLADDEPRPQPGR